jgi:Flp pilus assembly protein TadD
MVSDRTPSRALRIVGLVLLWATSGGAFVRADGLIAGADRPPTQDLGLLIPKGYQELEAARDHLKQGKPGEAFDDLKKATASHPELPPARCLMALLYFSAGGHDQGVAQLEQASVEAPEHPEIYTAFGKLAIAERRLTFARLAFEKAQGLKTPSAWTPARKAEFDRTCHQGLAYLAEARQDWERARAHLVASLEGDSKNGIDRHRLARALFWLGRRDEAYAELRKGSEADVRLEPAAVAMSRLYTQDHKPDKASEWLEKGVKDAPTDPRVRIAIANMMLERNLAAEAEKQVQSARSLGADSRELKRLTGLVARSRKKYEEAEKSFQSLAQDAPGDFFASNQLALVLASQDDSAKWPRALQLAEVNARAFPNEQESLSTLGWVLFRIGRTEDAERVLRTAVTRGPIGSDTAYYLGMVLHARGNSDDARRLVRSAVDAEGAFINLDDAKKWLEAHPTKP